MTVSTLLFFVNYETVQKKFETSMLGKNVKEVLLLYFQSLKQRSPLFLTLKVDGVDNL